MRDEAAPPVTLEHVARAAGVSRATASRALTGTGPVSDEALRRVRRAADALGYVADPVARALVHGAGTRVVVAVTSDTPDVVCTYLARVLTAGARVCTPQGLGIGVVPLRRANPLPALDRLARDRTVAGVVLLNTTHEVLDALPRGLRGRTVSIGVGSADVPSVDVDGPAVGRRAAEHLIRAGRRRIAMITGPSWLPCAQRPVEAFRAAVAAAGLPVRTVPGGFEQVHGETGAAAVLARWPDTDAVVGICDAVALGALRTLRRLGRRVPEDVAVAGFDDLPIADAVDLTSATHPVEDIAAAAVGGTLTRLAAGGTHFFPSELVVRQSA
ncbi:LacI family DNA-binding transcriptional regulator [Blastococcus sp. SYSU D00669]